MFPAYFLNHHHKFYFNKGIILSFALYGLALFSHSMYAPAHGASLTLDNEHRIDISGQLECGAFDDHALRATFGLEFQIFRCSKAVLGFSGKHDNDGADWRYKIEFAPLYDSIQRKENGTDIPYGTAKKGQIAYLDWYKNLGTRNYYLGDVPLIDAYIERRFGTGKNYLRIGRQRNFIALTQTETPWGDDGKFAPYADWLTRDLYTGIAYGFQGDLLQINLALFSGNNPIKGGGYYLNGAISPNVKGNNTGIYAGKLGLHQRGKNWDWQVYLGTESNALGSTWAKELGDGKRNNDRKLGVFKIARKFNGGHEIGVLGQRTQYLTGLSANSAQATAPDPDDSDIADSDDCDMADSDDSDTEESDDCDKENPNAYNPKRFYNITQYGTFGGIYYRGRKFNISYIAENIDRFDYKIYAYDGFQRNRENLQQRSYIYQAGYQFNQFYTLQIAWHDISNHAPEVSEIVIDYNGDPIDYETRFKIVTQINF